MSKQDKKIITEKIFTKYYKGEMSMIPVSDLPKDLLPTDYFTVIVDGGYYSENNSWDPFTELVVFRKREETDEEVEKRISYYKELQEESKQKRYEQYLKLKQEFGN